MASQRQVIGTKVRQARETAGMTQEQLATAIGVEAATLSRYETGRWAPRIETLERIGKVLKASVGELLGEGTPPMPPGLRADEKELLGVYKSLSPAFRKLALRLVREIRRSE